MSEKVMKWAIICCENCNVFFAVQEITRYTHCPECGCDEVIGTGEFLGNTLYTEDGRVIQKGIEWLEEPDAE